MQNRCICHLSEQNPSPHHTTYPSGAAPAAVDNLESDNLIVIPTLPNLGSLGDVSGLVFLLHDAV